MTRIQNNRQVGEFFYDRDGIDVGRIACVAFEGADSSFAENDLIVPEREQVFAGVPSRVRR